VNDRRWVRLLLGREFHLEDVMTLWDAMFAYSTDLRLIDHICVAMLIFIRQHRKFFIIYLLCYSHRIKKCWIEITPIA
jgi:hypothetical protein